MYGDKEAEGEERKQTQGQWRVRHCLRNFRRRRGPSATHPEAWPTSVPPVMVIAQPEARLRTMIPARKREEGRKSQISAGKFENKHTLGIFSSGWARTRRAINALSVDTIEGCAGRVVAVAAATRGADGDASRGEQGHGLRVGVGLRGGNKNQSGQDQSDANNLHDEEARRRVKKKTRISHGENAERERAALTEFAAFSACLCPSAPAPHCDHHVGYCAISCAPSSTAPFGSVGDQNQGWIAKKIKRPLTSIFGYCYQSGPWNWHRIFKL